MSTALTIRTACDRLSVSRTRLYELIGSGDIAAIKIGRRTMILEAEIARFLSQCTPYRPGSNNRARIAGSDRH